MCGLLLGFYVGYGNNLRILKSEFRNDHKNHKSFYILVITNLYPSIVFHSLHSEKKQVHWVGFSSSSLMSHIINGTKATHVCCGFNLQNVIRFCSFTFNSSSSRYSIGEFNVCFNVMSITVTPKNKTD